MVRPPVLLAAAIVAAPALARAQSTAPPAAIAPAPPAGAPRPLPAAPALHHIPLTTAVENEPLAVRASIDRPDLVRRAILVYRRGSTVSEVPFERSAANDRPYAAVVPADQVQRPGIEYAIEIERTDGERVAVFASRDDMQPVEVVGDLIDEQEDALLARLRGRRFVVEASGEYASFGTTPAPVCATQCQAGTQSPTTLNINDSFWHAEGGVTYRILRTVSEIGIRGGVYRGTSPVPGATDPGQLSVGLNYAAPWMRLRATDWLHLEGEFLTSITEVGFSLGGGGAFLFGDAYGTHLTLGFESINVFGTRGYSRFDVVVTRRLRVAPSVEVTNMPHASTAGERLLGDFAYDLGAGWSMTVRVGYQARTFYGGGPGAGGGLNYAF